MQMFRQHQIRPPRMPHGMAVTLSEEILRIMQDILPLHEALRSIDACNPSLPSLRPTTRALWLEGNSAMDTVSMRGYHLDMLATMVHTSSMASLLLAC
jgi:hypothetical protein